MCLSVHGGGGPTWPGSMHGRRECVAGEMATASGGTHPTRMHSYCVGQLLPLVSCTMIP